MSNAAAKLTFIILTFNVSFINQSHDDKEDVLFKIRPKPKVYVQLRWVSLLSKPSWFRLLNREKQLMKTWVLY